MKAKHLIKKSLKVVKKVINSNKHTKRVAVSVKKLLIKAIGTDGPREVYNISSFYPTIQDYYNQTKDYDSKRDPLISILLPTYNTPEIYLRECIESIIIQSYPNWELCIADDNSTDKNVVKVIEEYQKKDNRIKLVKRPGNGHISEATNSAFAIAKGDFVALMDHDDILWPNALYEMIKVIRADKKVDLIYTDEDKLDSSGKIHSYPFLKPDFSPEFLESCNYITHFSCIRTTVMKQINGFRKGYEGAQDWDLFIRISEITQNITHIPKILYSWRIHEASTASSTDAKPYVYEAQKKLLVDHIDRTGMTGTVETGIIPQHRTIKYDIKANSSVAVIIHVSSLVKTERLIASLDQYSSGIEYSVFYCYSINIASSERTRIKSLLKNATKQEFIKISDTGKYYDIAKAIKTDYQIYIEDTLSLVSDNWAKIFVADAQRKDVGLVAPVILDSSKANIVSAGIGVGYGQGGLVDMLNGMPFDDPHYSRGLYAKSRRNVTAVNPATFAVSRKVLLSAMSELKDWGDVVALAIYLTDTGHRNVYTPYVQFITNEDVTKHESSTPELIKEDRMLNPNFNHDNGRMEVRQ